MIRKLLAWKELLKLGNVSYLRKEIDSFFFGIVLQALDKEGWFDFFREGKTEEQLIDNYGYTDIDFLSHLLDLLIKDNVLVRQEEMIYPKNIHYEVISPSIFSDSLTDIWKEHANFLPERLKGKYMEFTSGINLFNWDDALATKMYEQIRRSAFAFSGALRKQGNFLDVGCGNGYGTAAIWNYYYGKGSIEGMKLVGIDPSETLLEIAKEEFWDFVRKHNPLIDGKIQTMELPEFIEGSALHIPFEDATFDMVYASQVLHWTDTRKAIEEMLRVTKSGGMVFGTQNFYPNANPYGEVLFFVVEGAGGFVTKEQFKEYAYEAGARKVEFATPISIFKILK
ncbi:MAG: class I SAM-dependent methyltransferase [Methanobacteriota archaeon]|nr:MAG: class I SAM-dependent methyltransferase [Euryarchaeota archaeon]